jgi:hypothetical protein
MLIILKLLILECLLFLRIYGELHIYINQEQGKTNYKLFAKKDLVLQIYEELNSELSY